MSASGAMVLKQDLTGIWRDAAGEEVRVWQRLLSGRRLNLLDPSPFDFEDEDLARGLAGEARWNAQTRGEWPFSVAQHSVECLLLARKLFPGTQGPFALAVLLHDAAEGLGGKDLITPLKNILGEAYRAVLDGLQRVIHMRYGLPPNLPDDWHKRIKKVDRILAATEAYQLAGYTLDEVHDPRVLGNPEKPDISLKLEPWSPAQARERFLEELRQLVG